MARVGKLVHCDIVLSVCTVWINIVDLDSGMELHMEHVSYQSMSALILDNGTEI